MSETKDLSRSDVARQRRAKRVVKELAQTSKRALKPAVTVSARVASANVPTRRQVVKPRRFNIAMGMPDINLHRPTVPHLHASWRLGSVFIIILIGLALYLSLSMPYFRVSNITMDGNSRITHEEIETVLGVLGQSIFTVHPDEVETRLRMNFPEVLSAQVNVYLPNHVYLTLTEREPVILWQQGEGYTWIDSTGVAFRPRGFVTGLVLVNGMVTPPVGTSLLEGSFAPEPYMQKELVDSILLLAPYVPADSTMVFDRTFGLGWTDSRGWKSFFGTSAEDMPLKVRVYQTLVASLVSRGISPTLINVMYPDAPFYRVVTVEAIELTMDSGQ
jgi:hypothetical protein